MQSNFSTLINATKWWNYFDLFANYEERQIFHDNGFWQNLIVAWMHGMHRVQHGRAWDANWGRRSCDAGAVWRRRVWATGSSPFARRLRALGARDARRARRLLSSVGRWQPHQSHAQRTSRQPITLSTSSSLAAQTLPWTKNQTFDACVSQLLGPLCACCSVLCFGVSGSEWHLLKQLDSIVAGRKENKQTVRCFVAAMMTAARILALHVLLMTGRWQVSILQSQ